jgi:death on curing protein
MGCSCTDLFEMAAAYLYYIVQKHPFVDGNKRAGAAIALVFLDLDGLETDIDNDALVEVVLLVAPSKAGKAAVAAFFRERSVPRPVGE